MPDVIVVGAGPVGLVVAGELARRGVDVTVIERRSEAGAGTRAIGVHAPVLAALEASGVTDSLLTHALRVGRGEARAGSRTLGIVRFDRLSTRFPFVATLPQAATEAVLRDFAPRVERGATVTRISESGEGVRAHVAGATGEREITARLAIVATGWSGADARLPSSADARIPRSVSDGRRHGG